MGVYAVYSLQRDRFTTNGEDKVICEWSKDGELLIEMKMQPCHCVGPRTLRTAYTLSPRQTIAPYENSGQLMGRSLLFLRVMSMLSAPSAFLLMKVILFHVTTGFASGISKPISKSETHFYTMANSWLLPCQLMEIMLSVLNCMQKSMYGA